MYANVSDLYQDTFTEEDSFGYGDEKIYDSVLRYQAKVGTGSGGCGQGALLIAIFFPAVN